MNRFHFVPECWAETLMVRILFLDGHHKKGEDFYNHAEGISNVSRILKRQDVKGFMNIGFIDDDDKNVPMYFDEFSIIDELPTVTFKKHPSSNDFLVVVKPAIEKFLISQLKEIGKQTSDYGLPANFVQFRHLLKKRKLQDNLNYQAMILDLLHQRPSGITFIIEKVSSLR